MFIFFLPPYGQMQFLCKCFAQNTLIFRYKDSSTLTGRFGTTIINCTEFLQRSGLFHSYVLRLAELKWASSRCPEG